MTLTGDFVTGQPVTFQHARKLLADQGGGLQEGAVNGADLMVTQRGAGANMSVDIAAGFAWVQIDTGTNNGLAHVTSDAVANVAVTASNGTNPRIDQLILRYNDTAIPTGSGNTPTLEILTGTATSGATLNNRTGAAALPNDCLRLADILVPATSTSVVNTNIRDRRLWARGAAIFVRGNLAGSHTTTSTSAAQLAAGGYDMRLETGGNPVDIDFDADVTHSVTNGTVELQLNLDGAGVAVQQVQIPTGTLVLPMPFQYTIFPSAGSHLLQWQWFIVTAGTATMINTGLTGPQVRFREIVRQNLPNNSVTSG
jgi:hypothetical protein